MKKLKLIFLVFIIIISGCSNSDTNSDTNKEKKFSDIYPGNYKKITKITCNSFTHGTVSFSDITDKTKIAKFLDALEKYTFTFDEDQSILSGSEYGINFYDKKDNLILVCSVTQDRIGLGHPDTLNSGVYYRIHGGWIIDAFSDYLRE